MQGFAELFRGYSKARGVLKPDAAIGRASTEKVGPTAAHFEAHLRGEVGLGVTPTDETGHSYFAAIDIDAHEETKNVDIITLEEKVREWQWPALVCQTRRHGAHVYLFFSEPVPTSTVRKLLTAWSKRLKEFGDPIEVFPKQNRVEEEKGGTGNWINLPYFDAENGHRYCLHEGQPLDLEEFVELATSRRITHETVRTLAHGPDSADLPQDNEEAPPCVQKMLAEGITEGSRNNALFAVGTYFIKRGMTDILPAMIAANQRMFDKPLPSGTVKDQVKRLDSGSYQYKCDDQPLCDMCDRKTCESRKWGVGIPGAGGPPAGDDDKPVPIAFQGLKKVLSDPPIYLLMYNGVEVQLQGAELMTFAKVRLALFNVVGELVPIMKPALWFKILKSLNATREDIAAPDDAKPWAAVEATLQSWLNPYQSVNASGEPERQGSKEDLLRGIPTVMKDPDTGEWRVYFRGPDFQLVLQKSRINDYKGAELWNVLRKMSCMHERMRVGGNVLTVWSKKFNPFNIVFPVTAIKERF